MSRNFAADGSTATAPAAPLSPHANTLDSLTALARFEFEPGKSKEGTKVMMVEWEDYNETRDPEGIWQVSWSGKTTVLPADEKTSENIRRFYFLLPPGTAVPPRVRLSFQKPVKPIKSNSGAPQPVRAPSQQHLTINPLPAIFPPGLGVTARAAGKKGVLHTIWAKKRLQVLEREIRDEQQLNFEGIALEMALAEKEWIEKNFGVTPRAAPLDVASIQQSRMPMGQPLNSPKSPTGRRLSEKLKGLSLGTSERDLAGRADGVNTPSHESHPLSPESSDVAFSSFNSFRNQTSTASRSSRKQITSQPPPDHVRRQQMERQQQQHAASIASMPSIQHVSSGGKDRKIDNMDDEGDDDESLFAKALSPRTPDVSRSPFSFSSTETMPNTKPKKGDS